MALWDNLDYQKTGAPQQAQPQQPGFTDKLLNQFGGQQGLMMVGASLLGDRGNFGQSLANGMMQAHQMAGQNRRARLQEQKVKMAEAEATRKQNAERQFQERLQRQAQGEGPDAQYARQLMGMPPEMQQALLKDLYTSRNDVNAANAKYTADQKNYQSAYGSNWQQAWARDTQRASNRSTTVNVNNNRASSFADEFGKRMVTDTYLPTMEDAKNAPRMINDLEQVRQMALNNPENFGTVQSAIQPLQGVLNSMGIELPDGFGDLTAKQQVDRISTDLVLNSTGGFGAQVSNSDREAYFRTVPQVKNTAESVVMMTEGAKLDQEQKLAVAKAMNQYIAENDTLDVGWQRQEAEIKEQFASQWNALRKRQKRQLEAAANKAPTRSLQDYAPGQQQQQPQQQGSISADRRNDLMQRYGLE